MPHAPHIPLSAADIAALALFLVGWLAYEPVLQRINRSAGAINSNMTVVRAAWMGHMARREVRLMDSQLMGHVLSSASFFASANLIIIAAAAGVLFGGDSALRGLANAPLVEQAPRWLLTFKLGLVVVALSRGLLDFVWSIRQMNYTLAAIGAAPRPDAPPDILDAYGQAAGQILNPALRAFNAGVRGYYFALAAGAWLAGPLAFAVAVVGAMTLLFWRQKSSNAAEGVRRVRALIEAEAARTAYSAAETPTPIGQDTPVPPTPQ